MPRGGRRPGAGAPRGNTNALKTGKHSVRVRAIIDALLADRETREVLLRLGSRGEVRNVYARELGLAMARLMHEQPIASAKRALAHGLGDALLARHSADGVNAAIATFESRSGRDALTGEPLHRRPRSAPSPWQSNQHVLRQFGLAAPPSKPENPPFTSAIDGRPYPVGPNGPIDPEEHARLEAEWESNRHDMP